MNYETHDGTKEGEKRRRGVSAVMGREIKREGCLLFAKSMWRADDEKRGGVYGRLTFEEGCDNCEESFGVNYRRS